MRRPIKPDMPLPADKGLISRALDKPPFYEASPAKPDIDYLYALEGSGFLEVQHPLNTSLNIGREATAIATICLLIAGACSKATREDRIEDLEDSMQELQRDAEDLVEQRDEILRRVEKIKDGIARERNEILQEIAVPAPSASDKPEPTPQEDTTQTDRKAKNEQNLAAITQAIGEVFQEGSVTATYYILPILQKMIEARYDEDEESNGVDWQYANFTPENKRALLNLIGSNKNKLENFIADTFKIIAKLPVDLQITLLIRVIQTLPSISKAITRYKKYRKILDHHDAWLKFHGDPDRQVVEPDSTKFHAYQDPCRNPKLHLEYEGSDTSWNIGKAPLDPTSKVPVQIKDDNGNPLYEGEHTLKPFIRAIHDLAKRIGIGTVESIFKNFQDRITGLKQTLGIPTSQEK